MRWYFVTNVYGMLDVTFHKNKEDVMNLFLEFIDGFFEDKDDEYNEVLEYSLKTQHFFEDENMSCGFGEIKAKKNDK